MSIRALLLTLSAVLCLASSVWAKTPNVVMIISDDQKWTDFAFMGHKTIQTPNLDRLGNNGLRFSQMYNAAG